MYVYGLGESSAAALAVFSAVCVLIAVRGCALVTDADGEGHESEGGGGARARRSLLPSSDEGDGEEDEDCAAGVERGALLRAGAAAQSLRGPAPTRSSSAREKEPKGAVAEQDAPAEGCPQMSRSRTFGVTKTSARQAECTGYVVLAMSSKCKETTNTVLVGFNILSTAATAVLL